MDAITESSDAALDNAARNYKPLNSLDYRGIPLLHLRYV